MLKGGLLLLMCYSTVVLMQSCEKVNIKLRQITNTSKIGILCSPEIENTKTVRKTVELLHRNYTIGIYKKGAATAQVCYWKPQPGLVFLTNLTGGTFYAAGKVI